MKEVFMNFRVPAVIVMGLAAAMGVHTTLRAQDATAHSVKDGAYTEAQAKRGEEIYATTCASCHDKALKGSQAAPPLTGARFNSNWDDLTAADLFDKILLSMPGDNPGSLAPEQVADIVAHIFSVSKLPAGKAELPVKPELLKQIKIEGLRESAAK
jgi:mono/diheme cytochrome c family protein